MNANARYGATSQQLMPDGFYPPPKFPPGVRGGSAVKMTAGTRRSGPAERWAMIEVLRQMGMNARVIDSCTPDELLAALLDFVQSRALPPHHRNPLKPNPIAGEPALAFADERAIAIARVRAEMTARERYERLMGGDPVGRAALERMAPQT